MTDQTIRAGILAEAAEITARDRSQAYGSPEDNFQNIADIWNAQGYRFGVNGIRNIATRYFKNELICQVSYAISLKDGRTIRLDVPVSRDYTEAQAKHYARDHAENYMFRLFDVEHRTGRFACCENFQSKGHRERCPAA